MISSSICPGLDSAPHSMVRSRKRDLSTTVAAVAPVAAASVVPMRLLALLSDVPMFSDMPESDGRGRCAGLPAAAVATVAGAGADATGRGPMASLGQASPVGPLLVLPSMGTWVGSAIQ